MRFQQVLTILEADDLEKFTGMEAEFSGLWGKILTRSTGRILDHVIESQRFNYGDVSRFLTKFNQLELQRADHVRHSLALLFHNTFTAKEYSKLLARSLKFGVWEIFDYVHGLGYRSDDLQTLIRYYPATRFRDLASYGYDLTEAQVEYDIKANRPVRLETLTSEIVARLRDKIIRHLNYDQLKFLRDAGMLTLGREDLVLMCGGPRTQTTNAPRTPQNTSGIILMLEEGFRLSAKGVNLLLGLNQPKRRRFRRRRRGRRGIGSVGSITTIGPVAGAGKTPSTYETDMIKILSKVTVPKIRVGVWEFLFGNRFLTLIRRLQELGHRPVLNRIQLIEVVGRAVRDDDLELIKGCIDLGVLKPETLCAESAWLDVAILRRRHKVRDYFINDLKMKCSKGILLDYVAPRGWMGFNRREAEPELISFPELVQILDTMNFPISDTVITEACLEGKVDVVRTLLERREGLLLTPRQLEHLLVRREYGFVSEMIERGAKLHKTNLIDRLLEGSMERYRRPCYNLVKYVRRKYKATASTKSVALALDLKSSQIIDLLVTEFGLTCETIPSQDLWTSITEGSHYWRETKKGECLKFYRYLVDNSVRLKIDLTEPNVASLISRVIENFSYGLVGDGVLEYLVEKFQYRLGVHDADLILEYGNLAGFRLLLKQGTVVTEELVDKVLTTSNHEMFKLMYQESPEPVRQCVTLAKFHGLCCRGYSSGSFLEYMDRELGLQISPYTVELYVKRLDYVFERSVLEYLIKRVDRKITQVTLDKLKLLLREASERWGRRRGFRGLTSLVDQCVVTEYQVRPEEMITEEEQMYLDNAFVSDSESEPEERDEVEELLAGEGPAIVVAGDGLGDPVAGPVAGPVADPAPGPAPGPALAPLMAQEIRLPRRRSNARRVRPRARRVARRRGRMMMGHIRALA